MNSTLKKPLIILLALMAMVMFTFNFTLNAKATNVSVGSMLFTDIDNVTITGTKNGLELSSTGKVDSSAKYGKLLYFKGFSFKFKITEANFSSIIFTILPENNNLSDTTENKSDIDRQIIIKLTKTDSGMKATLNGAFETDLTSSFTDEIELGLNSENKFFVKIASEHKVINSAVSIYKNEANMTIGFEGIQVTKTAKLLIKNINRQAFTSDIEGFVDDDKPAVMRLNTDLITTESPLNKSYEIPVYGIDVLSTNLKYDVKVAYSADNVEYEEEKTFTTTSIEMQKAGYYKITEIKLKDNNGNETTICEDRDLSTSPIIIRARAWSNDVNDVPVITTFDGGANEQAYLNAISSVYNGGATNKFYFKAPEVTVNSTPAGYTENPKLIKFRLGYKLVSSNSWTYVDGLVFTASSINSYNFRIQAIDRMGNLSSFYDFPNPIFFIDVTKPKISVNGFPTEKYLDQQLTLPTASVSDDMDTSPKKAFKIYYIKDANGVDVFEKDENGDIVYETDENDDFLLDSNNQKIPKKILIDTKDSYTFTPDKLGWYEVLYTAEDSSGNKASLSSMTFNVVEAVEPVIEKPFIDVTNIWNIVFLSIAGLSALGLIIIPFIKTKEEDK